MLKIKTYLSLIILSLMLFGCSNDEDKTKEVSKEGSIETQLSVEHFSPDKDILTTKHKIWIKNNLYKEIVLKDTIPFLGYTKAEGEDQSGNSQTVNVKKDYEFYITVK